MHEPRVFGNDLLAADAIMSGARSTRSRRPRKLLGRALSALVWIVCTLVGTAVYSNVIVDDSALRARAESLACERAGGNPKCQITRMVGRRSVVELQAEYDIEGAASVRVVCRRSAIIAGEHQCSVH